MDIFTKGLNSSEISGFQKELDIIRKEVIAEGEGSVEKSTTTSQNLLKNLQAFSDNNSVSCYDVS